jgi:hypothetical protein
MRETDAMNLTIPNSTNPGQLYRYEGTNLQRINEIDLVRVLRFWVQKAKLKSTEQKEITRDHLCPFWHIVYIETDFVC